MPSAQVDWDANVAFRLDRSRRWHLIRRSYDDAYQRFDSWCGNIFFRSEGLTAHALPPENVLCRYCLRRKAKDAKP